MRYDRPRSAIWVGQDGSMPTKQRGKLPTPDIIMAASDGDLATVRAELEHGADVNAVDRGGGTALHQAACNHHVPVVTALLAAGADVRIADSGGWTALHFAARELQLEIAKRLLDAGAALDAKDKDGNTPLRRAIAQRELVSSEDASAMIELLRRAGKQPTPKPKAKTGSRAPATVASYEVEAKRIWQTYVPPSGQAKTVQGELLRAVEKLRDEAQRNGNVNWDDGHVLLARFLRDTLSASDLFDAKQRSIIARDVKRLENYKRPATGDDVYDRLTERVVDWCRAHAKPVLHRRNPKLRR